METLSSQLKETTWLCHPMASFARRSNFNEAAGAQDSKRIAWLWSDLKWCSTSHIEDEVIVSANLLGVKGALL